MIDYHEIESLIEYVGVIGGTDERVTRRISQLSTIERQIFYKRVGQEKRKYRDIFIGFLFDALQVPELWHRTATGIAFESTEPPCTVNLYTAAGRSGLVLSVFIPGVGDKVSEGIKFSYLEKWRIWLQVKRITKHI